MIRLESDYLEGAHPQLMEALVRSNLEQTPGYSMDHYCEEARQIIRTLCAAPEAAVHFLVGGTQVNRTVILSALRPHQGVVAVDSGHIAVHESGAIENSGHKVLTVPAAEGKLRAGDLEALAAAHWNDETFEHMVQPGMVYISNPTELGTVYTKAELSALSEVCRKYRLPLYMDGARLGCALAWEGCDYDLAFLAQVCDAFTIGGTKLGALFGEAAVISNPAMAKDFRYLIKQGGGLFAKGRLLGIQFKELLRDGLYFEIGRHENHLARKLRRGLEEQGFRFTVDSPTNQQFVSLPNELLKALDRNFSYSLISAGEEESTVRFCTSWASREEDVDALLSATAPFARS